MGYMRSILIILIITGEVIGLMFLINKINTQPLVNRHILLMPTLIEYALLLSTLFFT